MSKLFVRPAGLLLALMCFAFFPLLAVSCDTPMGSASAEYTGADFVFGGEPNFTGSAADEATSGEEGEGDEGVEGEDEGVAGEDGQVGPQPLAVLAFLAIIGSLVLAVVPRLRAHTLTNLGASAAVLLLLVVNQIVLHDSAVTELEESEEILAPQAAEMVETRYGFWLTLLVLLAVVAYNVVELLRERGGSSRAGAFSGGYPTPPSPPGGGAPAGPGSAPPSGGG
jgi:hypothetical protein